MSNPENPNFDDQQNPEGSNPQDSDIDFSAFFGGDDESVDLDAFADLGTSEVEELAISNVGQEDAATNFSELTESAESDIFASEVEAVDESGMLETEETPLIENSVTEVPVVEDKKSKTAKKEKPPKKEKAPKVKKEKPPKKEKAPKVKKEKKPRTPGEKQPWDVAALCFATCLVWMIVMFGGVNAYAFMKHGMGALTFLAIFDMLALGALAIPFLLRRAKDNITAADVSAGMSVVSLIFGCMFLLANLAYIL